MHILITGGTGFVGRALCQTLMAQNHTLYVWTRHPAKARKRFASLFASMQDAAPMANLHFSDQLATWAQCPIDAVINLAGEPIADQRWSPARKALLVESRVQSTQKLVAFMQTLNPVPKVLLSASAVGFYGAQGTQEVREDSPTQAGFTHELCAQWEEAAQAAEALGTRVCRIRIGLVLEQEGGSLAKMLPAFKLGLGGRLGSGEQYMPWIHRQDLLNILLFLLERPHLSGAFNASAPTPVTNAVFTRQLGQALGRPACLPMPAPVLKLIFGEMAQDLLLTGTRMLPARLLSEGFSFQYPTLDQAFSAIFAQSMQAQR